MGRRLSKNAAAFLGVVALAGWLTQAAGAELAFSPCKETNNFACAKLSVPLDPAGVTPGTISLSLRRHRAPLGEAHTAIVALAGGPGQSALPFAEESNEMLGAIAASRDEIFFDQRGTGSSQPLSCRAFKREPVGSFAHTVAVCAAQIGAMRAFYTTADSVADIEAIRRAGGYEKLILYGTSYGTLLAELYAAAHPEHVEALILDSVVPPAGKDALDRPTFAAIPRILRQLCAGRLCAHVTSDPVADLARVLARMHGHALHPRVRLDSDRPARVSIDAEALFSILLAGDFSDLLRSELVTDLSSAARGDEAPLARFVGTLHSGGVEQAEEGFDLPLYYATVCEEEDFPWSRAAAPAQRLREALTAARAEPRAAFAPFGARDAYEFGDITACDAWPFSSPAPAAAPQMPDVPTLILSGKDDLRTPTSNALALQAAIPDAKLVVVPYTGHSVLGDEPGDCASKALQAFFAAKPIAACRGGGPPPFLRPPPRPPLNLSALSPAHPYHGSAGRTVAALRLTLGDLARQLILHLAGIGLLEFLSLPNLAVGGLRSGTADFRHNALVFDHYAFVPGVTLTGTLKGEAGKLVIGGSSAAHGTLDLGPHDRLSGDLDGQRVRVASGTLATVAIVGSDAVAGSISDSRRAALRRLPRSLTRLIGWLIEL